MITNNKNNKLFLANILCLISGALLRILYCIKYPVPVRDSYVYKEFIEKWSQTGVIPDEPVLPPLGISLLKIPFTLFNFDIIKGGIIINIVLGLCLILIIIKISYIISSSESVGFLTGLLVAAHPSMISYSCEMIRENSYLTLCSLSALFALLFYRKKSVKHIILVACFACGAYMCRHEGLEIIPATFSIIFIIKTFSMKKKIAMCSIYIISYLVSFLLFSYFFDIPLNHYLIYNKKYSDSWMQSE